MIDRYYARSPEARGDKFEAAFRRRQPPLLRHTARPPAAAPATWGPGPVARQGQGRRSASSGPASGNASARPTSSWAAKATSPRLCAKGGRFEYLSGRLHIVPYDPVVRPPRAGASSSPAPTVTQPRSSPFLVANDTPAPGSSRGPAARPRRRAGGPSAARRLPFASSCRLDDRAMVAMAIAIVGTAPVRPLVRMSRRSESLSGRRPVHILRRPAYPWKTGVVARSRRDQAPAVFARSWRKRSTSLSAASASLTSSA